MVAVTRGNVPGPVDLVGRRQELAELAQALGLDGGDQGFTVLLSGDAGIGKTRLLRALADTARAQGRLVVTGHCLDLGENALPYLPVTEIVSRLTDALPGVVAEAAARHPALLRLEPGRRVLGGEEGDAVDRGLDRGALFAAVRELLERVAAATPLLVVVEDLHWADSSTRDLLTYLLGRPFSARVALVVSYRSDDLHRRHPLRPLVAGWARLRSVHRLALEPLPVDDVRRLVGALHPQPLPSRALREIVDRAEGNPFFVEELVAAVAEPGGTLPADLADLLLVRLDRLDDEARAVVRLAAVAGRRVRSDLLAAVSGLPPARLDEALRSAVELTVLRVEGEYVAFRHALLAEAVYDDLLPGERVRLHADYVAALAERRGRGTAAELSRHARRALDRATAATAGLAAAREAMSVGGPVDAVRHYEHVLELLGDPQLLPGEPEALGLDPAVVAVEAAEALSATGHVDRAADLAADHLDRLGPQADPRSRARLLSAWAIALSMIETPRDPAAISAEAVRLVGPEDSPLRARLLAVHARILQQRRHRDEAREAGIAAIELAERLGLPAVASDAFTTVSRLAHVGGEEDGQAALRAAVERARGTGNREAELRGLFWLALSCLNDADWVPAQEHLRAAVALADAGGTPWAPYHFESRWYLGQALLATGDWDEALAVLADPDEHRPPVPVAMLEVLRATVDAARGADVRERIAEGRRHWAVEGLVASLAGGLQIEAAGRAGSPDDAVAAYDGVTDLLRRIWSPAFEAAIRLAATTLSVLADAAGDLPAAQRPAWRDLADRLLGDIRTSLAPLAHQGPETQAWAALALAQDARLRLVTDDEQVPADDLRRLWMDALAAFERFGDVHRLAWVRAFAAEVLHATGDDARARSAVDAARATAVRLGATPLLARLDRVDRVLGIVPGSPSAPYGVALTPREREVLALVAQGRSNGEIGKRLFISTKTASVHVSNILAKLGASGRTEAAALARRQGLLAD